VRTSVGPLLAGILYAVIPELIGTWSLPEWVGQLPPLLFGLGAIGLAREPRGVVAQTSDQWVRLAQRLRAGPPAQEASEAAVSLR
jgi:branched-chain amino acid transport system permease protein